MPQDFVQRCKLKSALRYFRIDYSSVIEHQSSGGSSPPLFLDQTGPKKNFVETAPKPPPLVSGSGRHSPPPPPLPEGLFPPVPSDVGL